MGKKIKAFFKGELFISIFYLLFGICMLVFPVQTINLISKLIFSILLMGTGIYHLLVYISQTEEGTVLDMFTGVIVLVLGFFLMMNPQVVVKLLPMFLGAVVLVDSVSAFRGAFRMKKLQQDNWQIFLGAAVLCIIFGIVILVNPFSKTRHMVFFAGIVFLLNGLKDLALFVLTWKINRAEQPKEEEASPVEENHTEQYEEYDPEYAKRLSEENASEPEEAAAEVEVEDTVEEVTQESTSLMEQEVRIHPKGLPDGEALPDHEDSVQEITEWKHQKSEWKS